MSQHTSYSEFVALAANPLAAALLTDAAATVTPERVKSKAHGRFQAAPRPQVPLPPTEALCHCPPPVALRCALGGTVCHGCGRFVPRRWLGWLPTRSRPNRTHQAGWMESV